MKQNQFRALAVSPFRSGMMSIAPLAAVLGLLASAFSLRGQSPQNQATRFSKTFAIREVRNVPYQAGQGTDLARHKLDLYLPRGQKDCPVIVFVHGGAWLCGDKNFFGCGTAIGRCFARQGVVAVMPSYRLSPAVKHPDHVKDVARAFAWTYQNIRKYGGSPGQIFLCGHSAGGHLVSLLATDPKYLKAEGLKSTLIKGVISVSGVYQIPHLDLSLTQGEPPAKNSSALATILDQFEVQINPLSLVFGSDTKVLKDASPLNHVKPGLPPFLLINAANDLLLLPEMAHDFATALKKAGCEVQTLTVGQRDHETVMFEAITSTDPVTRSIRAFVLGHLAKKNR
jgi:acetyl esterase/lipase